MKMAVLLFSALPLLVPTGLCAQEQDSFEAIDNMLDARFDESDDFINARYDAVHLAVDRAFKGLTKRIELSWGKDTKVPTREEWVTYSASMKTRMSLDFKAREVVVETVLDGDSDLEAGLQRLGKFALPLLESTAADLNRRDSLLQAINQELEQGGAAHSAVVAAEMQPELVSAKSVVSVVLPVARISESLQAPVVARTVTKPGEVVIVEQGAVKKLQFRHAFVNNAQARLIESQIDTIRLYARQFDVPVSVVLAIIETESSFNPRAVSPIPAFGLMQLVPRTAGVDAYQHVHGEKRVLSAEYLFDERHNIELGTAYLSLVRDGYLRLVENPYSRFYCAIAAYNTGVGNLAKTFSGTTSLKSAARRINRMSEQEVYDFLIAELPAQETRDYLAKILDRVENYKHLDVG